MMLRLTELAQRLIREAIVPGAWAVDATVGNGHDTRMLADAVGLAGHVIGFDVQEAALANARLRLGQSLNVTLHRCGHEHLAAHLPTEAAHRLAAVMFNLGYLPGAQKANATHAKTTVAALEQSTAHLGVGGRITMMLYSGHPGGADEAVAVHAVARALPPEFAASCFSRVNATTAVPELILIERLK